MIFRTLVILIPIIVAISVVLGVDGYFNGGADKIRQRFENDLTMSLTQIETKLGSITTATDHNHQSPEKVKQRLQMPLKVNETS